MEYIQRDIDNQILKYLQPNKVILILGARRTGKTFLLKQIIKKLNRPYLFLNGEDISTLELLERRSVANYEKVLGSKEILILDEAQKIPEIGKILKLMVDEIEGIQIIVTGSSAFDIRNDTGEPLTGRKKTFHLYPFSENEYNTHESIVEHKDKLLHRLIYGNYPELIRIPDDEDKADYLQELVSEYLFKDILVFENIRSSAKIVNLLRLVAFQIGREVSLQELGVQLSMSKNTVEKYLDLLTKVFVLHKVEGFSRNLRKEVTKTSRWYFYDNGLRNILIANMNPIHIRNDVGELWENYVISERLKYQSANRMLVNNYFWRTYDQQEIDWVEERGGKLYGYEMKWNPKRQIKIPASWKKEYPEAEFIVITPDNYLDWVS